MPCNLMAAKQGSRTAEDAESAEFISDATVVRQAILRRSALSAACELFQTEGWHCALAHGVFLRGLRDLCGNNRNASAVCGHSSVGASSSSESSSCTRAMATRRSACLRSISLTPWVARPVWRTVSAWMRTIMPAKVISISESPGVTLSRPTTSPFRWVTAMSRRPLPPRDCRRVAPSSDCTRYSVVSVRFP